MAHEYMKAVCCRIAMTGLGILILMAGLWGQNSSVTILGGQGMHVTLETDVGSRISHPGDRFSMRLLEPLVIENRELLPKGTIFQGKILSVLAGDAKTRTLPEIRTAFDEVLLPNGGSFLVTATAEEQRHSEFETRGSVTAAFFGAAAVRFDDFTWKKGRTGWLRLKFDLVVPSEFTASKAAGNPKDIKGAETVSSK